MNLTRLGSFAPARFAPRPRPGRGGEDCHQQFTPFSVLSANASQHSHTSRGTEHLLIKSVSSDTFSPAFPTNSLRCRWRSFSTLQILATLWESHTTGTHGMVKFFDRWGYHLLWFIVEHPLKSFFTPAAVVCAGFWRITLKYKFVLLCLSVGIGRLTVGVYLFTCWSTLKYGNLDSGGGSCQTMQRHGTWPYSTPLGLSLSMGHYRPEHLSILNATLVYST